MMQRHAAVTDMENSVTHAATQLLMPPAWQRRGQIEDVMRPSSGRRAASLESYSEGAR